LINNKMNRLSSNIKTCLRHGITYTEIIVKYFRTQQQQQQQKQKF
jgi:hypothetical protein